MHEVSVVAKASDAWFDVDAVGARLSVGKIHARLIRAASSVWAVDAATTSDHDPTEFGNAFSILVGTKKYVALRGSKP